MLQAQFQVDFSVSDSQSLWYLQHPPVLLFWQAAKSSSNFIHLGGSWGALWQQLIENFLFKSYDLWAPYYPPSEYLC